MRDEYPNYPLIEERFKNFPIFQKLWKETYDKQGKESRVAFLPDIRMETFYQNFPNTAGIFENGGFSGQAFILQYITVVHELNTDVHAVFGGNRMAYLVQDANDFFYQDIQAKHMATLREAQARY